MEIGLLAINAVRLSGRLLPKFIRIIAGFFRLLLGDIFYRILVKIYYHTFKLRKSGLTEKTLNELDRNRLIYLFVFILTAFLIFSNLIGQTKAGAADRKISKTILANLVPTEFGPAPEEELIEEKANLNNLLVNNEKYLEGSDVLVKAEEGGREDNIESHFTIFNDTGDLVFKPQNLSGGLDGIAPTRTEIIEYTVQTGDTVSSIARHFNLSINTILWANNLSSFSLIRPGNNLTILPANGLLYTVKKGDTINSIANKYQISGDKILSGNDLSAGLKIGQKIILPGARKITEAPVIATSGRTGLGIIGDLIKTPTPKNSESGFTWPTDGHRITQYFSWRHPGLDIGNKVGTPLYAAADGVVEISQGGWNGGYGNTVLINHGGGKKTRYGHATKLLVKKGEAVVKGQIIALMGSTGRSTGSHLHFEIIINGGKVNPLNYIR